MSSIIPVLYLAALLSTACQAFSSWSRPLPTRSFSLRPFTEEKFGRQTALLVSQLDRALPIENQVIGENNGPQLLHEFIYQKKLREALRQCRIFEGVSTVELEGLVQSCTTLSLSVDDDSNGVVFRQGDKGDAMYMVQSGTIEIVRSTTHQEEVVLATVEPGGLFGELALFFDEPRAASARVARGDDEVRLWRLSQADYVALVTRNTNIQMTAVRTVEQDPNYSNYLERRELVDMMKSQCPIFRGFDKTDLQRCAESMEQVAFQDKDVIIQQGDQGEAMYFVKSGRVICSLGGTGKVLSEIGAGGYFGELALLFDKPRAATVQAFGKDVVLWKLSADKFAAAVQEYPLADKTLELLREQYQTKTIFSTLSKSTVGEVTDVIRAASRPKKKNVSTHSVISTMYASMLVSTILPQLNPMVRNIHGIPQLFSMDNLSLATVQQLRTCCWLGVLVSLMGQFRIPKNAPQSRKKFFTSLTVTAITMLTFGDSNLAGATSHFTFNIMSKFGGAVMILTHLACYLYLLGAIDDALVGTNRGRDTVPLCTSRLSATLFFTALCALFTLQLAQIICPVFDKVGYARHMLPLYRSGLQRLPLFGGNAVQGLMGFGALFGTLRFEKKISKWLGTALNMICLFFFITDQVAILMVNPLSPRGQLMQVSNSWISSVGARLHLNSIFFGMYAFTILNAFRRRIQNGIKD